MQCSTEELEQEVWAQIKQHVNVNGAEVLRDDNLVRWFLDPDVVYPNPFGVTINLEPLMINTSSSLQFRPEAFTEIPNLFLASDYVKRNTDVAYMEAANKAARRAVNALLDRERSSAARGAPTVQRLRPFAIPSRVGTLGLEADLVGKGCRPVVWIDRPFADTSF